MSKPKAEKKTKQDSKNINTQFPVEVYEVVQQVAEELGGMSLSALIRLMVTSKVKKYKETGDPGVFIDPNS